MEEDRWTPHQAVKRNQPENLEKPSKGKIAYMLGVFPSVSLTFVMREINAIIQDGYEVFVFAVKRHPDHDVDQHLFKPEILSQCTYARPDQVLGHLLANLKIAVMHPFRYFGALWIFLRQIFWLEPGGFFRLVYHFFCGIGFVDQLRTRRIAHMHCHFSTGSDMALAIHRFCGIPFSFTAHASGDIFIKPVLLQEKLRYAQFAVGVCEYSKAYLDSVTDYQYSRKITRNYNGVDVSEPERFLGSIGRWNVEKNRVGERIRLISVGRLIGFKGYGTFIETCRILKDKGYRIQCSIIGDGPDRNILEQMVQAKGVGGVITFSGSLPLKKVYEALAHADIFVLLSEIHLSGSRDAFPTVILEAMLMSLPVVSTWISGIPEIVVNGKTGFLVQERNPLMAAEAIGRLIHDGELRKRMGEAGRAKVLKDFDIDQTSKQLVQLFSKYFQR